MKRATFDLGLTCSSCAHFKHDEHSYAWFKYLQVVKLWSNDPEGVHRKKSELIFIYITTKKSILYLTCFVKKNNF